MAGVEKRDFDSPDESRTPDKTKIDVVHLGGTTTARFAMEPGWSWSSCVKPVAGTESCQAAHTGCFGSRLRYGNIERSMPSPIARYPASLGCR